MTERLIHGKLIGAGVEARCIVTRGSNPGNSITKVRQPLPDGEYALLVSGLVLKVRCTNGEWKQVDY
jgi:hypothetical protein